MDVFNTVARKSALLLVHLYRRLVSPFLGSNCRFYPSCSEYAVICLDRYSFFCAMKKIIFRVLKCNPFHPGGVDQP